MVRKIESKARELTAERGSQIVELALSLPFLMVLLVAIFDFGQAFNTKSRVTTGAAEATRYAVATSPLDLTVSKPESVDATRDIVASFLTNSRMDTCGLEKADAKPTGTEEWTFTSQGDCLAPLTLRVERAFLFKLPSGTTVIATRVTITYPIPWHFGRVATLIAPGSQFGGPVITVTGQSVMSNLS